MDRLGMARALVVAGLIGPIPYVSAQETVKLPAIQVVGKKPHASHKKPPARIRRPAVTSNKPVPANRPSIVSTAPLPGGAIEASKIPANVQSVPASAFEHTVAPSLTDAIKRALPGASRGDQTGNPFQPDFNCRGFTASPVPSTPEGIAVYQNGMRINEAFGDMVNWDLIPEMAIERADDSISLVSRWRTRSEPRSIATIAVRISIRSWA